MGTSKLGTRRGIRKLCQINVYQKPRGVFMDLYVSNVVVVSGVIAEDRNRIVRSAYLDFAGDFVFSDTQGNSDPYYSGLGTRWLLLYLTPADLAPRRPIH